MASYNLPIPPPSLHKILVLKIAKFCTRTSEGIGPGSWARRDKLGLNCCKKWFCCKMQFLGTSRKLCIKKVSKSRHFGGSY